MNVSTIIPQVRILEDQFDFGGITYGNTGVLTMTIVNDSNIQAQLNFDLRHKDSESDKEGLQCIEISYNASEDESVVLEERDPVILFIKSAPKNFIKFKFFEI